MNDTVYTEKPSALMEIVILGIPIVTVFVNIPAIFLIIWSAYRKENATNIQLLSVGITDALVGITTLLMTETYLNTQGLSYYDCSLRFYLFSTTFVASLLHVLGICIQRVKIVKMKNTPQHHQQYRRRTEWLIISLSWLISILVNSIPFGLWTKDREIEYCSFDNVYGPYAREMNYYIGALYSFVILVVLLAMIILFSNICTRGRLQSKKTLGPKDIKICVTIGIMAVLFVVTTLPLACLLLTDGHIKKKRNPRSIVVMVSLINSTINPFVYLYRIKENRDKLRRAICSFSSSSCCKPASVDVFVTDNSQPRIAS